MGCIYYHKNKINGDMYIGQSIYEPETIKLGRWGYGGCGYRGNTYFWNAIKKYGWNKGFEHGFFEHHIAKELLNEREQYYIAKYHTFREDPEYKGGYNLTPGGEESMNTWWPEEDAWLQVAYNNSYNKKAYISKLIIEFKNAFPETYHTDAAIRERLKTLRLSNIDNVNFWSEDELKILKENYSNLTEEQICGLLPNRSWETIRKKAQNLKLTRHIKCAPKWTDEELSIVKRYYTTEGLKVLERLPGRTKKGLYSRARLLGLTMNEEARKKPEYKKGFGNCKKVICIETGIIYNTVVEAYKSINKTSIQHALKTGKLCGGYHWKYVEE